MLPFVTFVTFGLDRSRFLCFRGLRCVVHGLSLRSARVPLACARSQNAAEGYAASSLALASSHHTATATRTFVCGVSYGRGSPATSQRGRTLRGYGLLSAARLHGYFGAGWGVRGRFHGTRGGAKGYGSVHGYRGMVWGWPFGGAEVYAVRTATNRAV